MIYGKRSDQELKYAKARAKATEYSVDPAEQPHFPYDSDGLHYSSVYALSQYADARLEGEDGADFFDDLRKTASFYDASANDGRNADFGDGYWTLAMATYFLLGNYGSAKVAADRVGDGTFYGANAGLFVRLVRYLFVPDSAAPEELGRLSGYLSGRPVDEASALAEAKQLMTDSNAEDSFFGRLLYVAVEDVVANSSRKLLPGYTGLGSSAWGPYFESGDAPKVLWQAQRAIGEAGVFRGGSAFVQLPTGSGKTKSVELLIRSRVLADDCALAVVIAPLRALCAEIARDLGKSLGRVAVVRLASDVMELDDWITSSPTGRRVLVFTPEKFGFVLRHGGISFDNVDLFVFDEAHLLDSATRGPGYELLLTEIVDKRPSAQKVLISAVVSNPGEIASWALGDSSSLATGEGVQVTEKSIALAREGGRKISYVDSSASGKEDFFLMIDLRPQQLDLRGRERNKRLFPDLGSSDKSRDLAVYYANRLIHNGACAIYVPRAQSVRKLFKRLSEIDSRHADLEALRASFDPHEAQAMARLITLHYGADDALCDGLAVGVLPHYGNLQGAIRQSVEYAVEQGLFRCVACTSTLAQGVNLPIKYLLITGVSNGLGSVRVRDFQNLVGRTARSGKYSEGSVLVVDRLTGWRGSMYSTLINAGNIERCKSAILGIYEDIEDPAGTGKVYPGASLVRVILDNIENPRLEYDLAHALMVGLKLDSSDAHRIASQRVKSLEAVESFIAGMSGSGETFDIKVVCESTFAYASATDDERGLLLALFESVSESLSKRDERSRRLCHIMQVGARRPIATLEWLKSPSGRAFLIGGCSDMADLTSEFIRPNPDAWAPFDSEQLAAMASLWISGDDISTIATYINSTYPLGKTVSAQKVEKCLSEAISFAMSNFVAGIIDVVRGYPELEPLSQCTDAAEELQRKLKYGVGNMRAATICEEVIEDRMIAKALVGIIGEEGPSDSVFIRHELRSRRIEVDSLMSDMPTYCKSRVNRWLDRQ